MQETYFYERQRFRGVLLFSLLGLIQALFLWGLFQQLVLGRPWGNAPAPDSVLVGINLFMVLLIIFFISIRLETVIEEAGFSFRMFPFHLKMRHYDWSRVQGIEVIKYNGLKDYWGYGLRYMPGRGWAYIISGSHGIRLTIDKHSVILVGTRKPDEVAEVIGTLHAKGLIN